MGNAPRTYESLILHSGSFVDGMGKHSGSIGRNLLATVVSVYLLHIFARKSMLTGEKREKEILHVIQNQLLLACCT